jgi:hypothetical protein
MTDYHKEILCWKDAGSGLFSIVAGLVLPSHHCYQSYFQGMRSFLRYMLPSLTMGVLMEAGLWIVYWYQVFLICFQWIIELYPIATLIIGALITGATVVGLCL